MIEIARPTAGHQGHADILADATGDLDVAFALVPSASMLFSLISCAKRHRFLGPINGVQASLAAAVVGTRQVSAPVCLASMLTTMHWLPISPRLPRISGGLAMAEELMLTLSAPALASVVFHGANTATNRKRHETLVAGTLDHIHDRLALMRAGGYVEEYHLISALPIVFQRQPTGSPTLRSSRLNLAELHPTRHLSIMNIQTRNDTFGYRAFRGGRRQVEAATGKVFCTYTYNIVAKVRCGRRVEA